MLLTNRTFDQEISAMEAMTKDELKQRILDYRGHIKLDFTHDYLETATIEHLRHILFAAMDNERYRNQADVS